MEYVSLPHRVATSGLPPDRYHVLQQIQAGSVLTVPPIPTFVSREGELRELSRMWEAAHHGKGSVALVCGEAGVGKSRLLSQLVQTVQMDGFPACLATAHGQPGSSFPGLRALLRALPRTPSQRQPETLFSQLYPSRLALFDKFVDLVAEQTVQSPFLLCIDDVADTDLSSADALAYLIRSVHELPILVVFAATTTCPTEFSHGDYTRNSTFQVIHQSVRQSSRGQRIQLGPMDRANVFRMVQRAFNRSVAKQVCHSVYQWSHGNPALVLSALCALTQQRVVVRDESGWTAVSSVQFPLTSTEGSIAHLLKESTQIVIGAASILFGPFTQQDIAYLVEEYWEEKTPVIVQEELYNAIRLQILTSRDNVFLFTDPQVRQKIYRATDESNRQKWHQRMFARLETLPRSTEHLIRGASHQWTGKSNNCDVQFACAAANALLRVHDYHQSALWLERAITHIRDTQTKRTLLEKLARLYSLTENQLEATNIYVRLLALGTDAPETYIDYCLQLSEVTVHKTGPNSPIPVLMKALQHSRQHCHPIQESVCQLRLGLIHYQHGDYRAALEHAIAGQLVTLPLKTPSTLAQLKQLQGVVMMAEASPAEATPVLKESLTLAKSADSGDLIAPILHDLARAAILQGDYPSAITSLHEAMASARAVGDAKVNAQLLDSLGSAYYFLGDWQNARDIWEKHRRIAEQNGLWQQLCNALNTLGCLYRELGQFDQALDALEQAQHRIENPKDSAKTEQTSARILANKGEVLFRRGNLVEANNCYQKALHKFELVNSLFDIVETKRRLCELDLATGKFQRAADRAIGLVQTAKDAKQHKEAGALYRIIATALRMQGDLDSASWFLDQARSCSAVVGSKYETAKIKLEAGELAVAFGHPDDADQLFYAAIEDFMSMGAQWAVTHAQARKQAIFWPRSSSASVQSRDGLTLIAEIARAANTLELDPFLNVAIDNMLEFAGFDRGFILLLNGSNQPVVRTRRIRPGTKTFARDDAEFSGTIVRRVAATRKAIAITDAHQDDSLCGQTSIVSLQLRQILCAPIFTRDRVTGIVYLDSCDAPKLSVNTSLLNALASQISLAIENSHLRAAERRRSELTSILAHEIRNPLASVLGFSEIGQKQNPDCSTGSGELFNHIRRESQRLRRVVDNIVELVRHESGYAQWCIKPFDITQLVSEIVQSYIPQCNAKNVSIDVQTKKQCGPVLGDPDRIAQVLTNLVSNAIKFTPSGGIVQIVAQRECNNNHFLKNREDTNPPVSPPRHQEYIRIDVKDSGPGMDEEVRSYVFQDLGKRGDVAFASSLGLGLYISKEIITRHGGSIWVDSAPQKGSTFSFRIPAS